MLQQMVSTPGHLPSSSVSSRNGKASPVARVDRQRRQRIRARIEGLGPRRPNVSEVEQMVDVVSRSMDRAKVRELSNMKRGLSVLPPSLRRLRSSGFRDGLRHHHRLSEKWATPVAAVEAGLPPYRRYLRGTPHHRGGLAVAIVSVWFYN